MPVESAMVPVIVTNVLTAAVLGGVIWNRMSNVEGELKTVWEKIDAQNGRVDKLERWRAQREGWQRGWDDRKEREEGPENG